MLHIHLTQGLKARTGEPTIIKEYIKHATGNDIRSGTISEMEIERADITANPWTGGLLRLDDVRYHYSMRWAYLFN